MQIQKVFSKLLITLGPKRTSAETELPHVHEENIAFDRRVEVFGKVPGSSQCGCLYHTELCVARGQTQDSHCANISTVVNANME